MQLIGMLDSPYVRRVAVSLKVLGLAFDLDQVSVFRQFEQFSALNPVVKAPSFITDDGVVLMDSNLILEHIAHLAPRSLMPADRAAHEIALRQIGLAMAACEKSVSILYERNQRPAEKQHQPWLDRVRGPVAGRLWRAGKGSFARLVYRRGADAAADHRGGGLAVQPAYRARHGAGGRFPASGRLVGAGRTAAAFQGLRHRLGARQRVRLMDRLQLREFPLALQDFRPRTIEAHRRSSSPA